MKIKTQSLLIVVLLAFVFTTMPFFNSQVYAATKDTINIPVYQNYGKSQDLLKQINKERNQRGLKSLTMDKKLTKHAIDRSAELCVMIPWTSPHMRPDGNRNSATDSVVYECCQEREIFGEDPSTKDVVKSWMSSPSHKAGILLSKAKSVGIAFVQTDDGRMGHYVLELSTKSADSIEKSTKKKLVNVSVKSKRDYLPSKAFSFKPIETDDGFETKKVGIYIRSYIDTKKSIEKYSVSNNNFKYKSSNTSVAAISKTGEIIPVKPGKVTFTITYKSNPKIKKMVRYSVNKSLVEKYSK